MGEKNTAAARTGLFARYPVLRVLTYYVVAPAVLVTLAWAGAIVGGFDIPKFDVILDWDDDDRPPIVVRNGSIDFQSGVPGNTRPWSADWFLGEWKPEDDNAAAVIAYNVTLSGFTPLPSACAAPVRADHNVWIDFTDENGGVAKFKFHIRKKHIFGKAEPKLDPGPNDLTRVNGSDPPRIRFGTAGQGYISNVKIDNNADCAIPKAATAVEIRLQPKRAKK